MLEICTGASTALAADAAISTAAGRIRHQIESPTWAIARLLTLRDRTTSTRVCLSTAMSKPSTTESVAPASVPVARAARRGNEGDVRVHAPAALRAATGAEAGATRTFVTIQIPRSAAPRVR